MSDFAWGGGGTDQVQYDQNNFTRVQKKHTYIYIKIDRQTMSTFRRFCDEQNGYEPLHY